MIKEIKNNVSLPVHFLSLNRNTVHTVCGKYILHTLCAAWQNPIAARVSRGSRNL